MRLYSISELAEILNVSESCIRAWIQKKIINYHKIGKLIRFDEDEIRRFYPGFNGGTK